MNCIKYNSHQDPVEDRFGLFILRLYATNTVHDDDGDDRVGDNDATVLV
jgi:hypothetical protein